MSEENKAAVVDDEMPLAPPTEGDTNVSTEVEISGEMDADIVATSTSMGEPIPAGTYHFKLKKYEQRGKPNDDGQGPDPNFSIQWECQDPRFANRLVFDIVTWVRPVDLQRRRMGDPDAIVKCKNRLGRMKDIQKAAGFAPQGTYDVKKDFLDKSPELKLQINVKEKKDKNPTTGKYDMPTGEMQNTIAKYLPLMRQA